MSERCIHSGFSITFTQNWLFFFAPNFTALHTDCRHCHSLQADLNTTTKVWEHIIFFPHIFPFVEKNNSTLQSSSWVFRKVLFQKMWHKATEKGILHTWQTAQQVSTSNSKYPIRCAILLASLVNYCKRDEWFHSNSLFNVMVIKLWLIIYWQLYCFP